MDDPLVGQRIVVRDWILEDLPSYRKAQTPGQKWQELDAPYFPRPSLEATDRTVERIADRIRRGDWPVPREVAVIADATTNDLIGRISRYWQSEETHWLSVGLVIFDPEHWGRGLGFEALGLWSDDLFASMPQLARLDLRTWSGNVGMIRLAEKLGYSLEAKFRNARVVDGKLYDGLGFGVLREEWAARYPEGFAKSL